ncbi:hypothetical protein TRIP_C60337 [Candidatus Zixiibacteriota bacterium]|nr:hypothetical protein TRIP_C60337 [candidate division Zixibacteria bacterium]
MASLTKAHRIDIENARGDNDSVRGPAFDRPIPVMWQRFTYLPVNSLKIYYERRAKGPD